MNAYDPPACWFRDCGSPATLEISFASGRTRHTCLAHLVALVSTTAEPMFAARLEAARSPEPNTGPWRSSPRPRPGDWETFEFREEPAVMIMLHHCGCGRARAAPPRSLRLAVRRVQGRTHPMPPTVKPTLELLDVQFAVVSISPQDSDGRRPTEAAYSWQLANQLPADPADAGQDVVGLEEAHPEDLAGAPPEFVRRLTTGVPGSAELHVLTLLPDGSALEEILPVINHAGAPASLNLSAGQPQPETPAA